MHIHMYCTYFSLFTSRYAIAMRWDEVVWCGVCVVCDDTDIWIWWWLIIHPSIHLLYPFIHCIHSSNSFIHPFIHPLLPFIPIEADCLLLLCNCHETNKRGCGQQSGGKRLVSHPFREHRGGRVRRYNPGRAAIVVQHWTGEYEY